jgi:branched-chain amino acid transport system ATP-binding protein
MANILEVKGLNVSYGKAKVINNVSINVEEGEIVTILGANGAGKTTILRSITGLKKMESGQVLYKNKRIDGMTADKIVSSGVAMVPEGRLIFGPMTVEENLQLGSWSRQRDRDGVRKSFEDIYSHFPILKERKNQMGGSLSGGQQQMLAVARALMANPKLMLMDEPSIGLSPLMVEEVGKIIKDVNSRGISVLLVEQNSQVALELAHRAYILEIGNIVLEGKCSDLINDERVRKAYLGGQ